MFMNGRLNILPNFFSFLSEISRALSCSPIAIFQICINFLWSYLQVVRVCSKNKGNIWVTERVPLINIFFKKKSSHIFSVKLGVIVSKNQVELQHRLPLVGYYCYNERVWLCLDIFYIAKLVNIEIINGNLIKYQEQR